MTTGIHTAAQNNQLSVVRTLVTENTKVIDEADMVGSLCYTQSVSGQGKDNGFRMVGLLCTGQPLRVQPISYGT
ncbi:hypothetical protein PISMIDRAFT_673112 [Pisolithus microcarpus 441]|uniref:Uncharacterized protein n=1 Tax=Pisolithus microcarpus 441 TaxID=765257 RepID=A0A0C9YUZ7_9AGAM|nr:hypothetical protein PISMIDRAFT_673112 [Pisolithus microcarpus 441]